jgi:hypothetical protein
MPKDKPLVLPPSIDDHAVEYLSLKATADAVAEQLKAKKKELLKLVNKTGEVPAGAEKSLRVEGDLYEVTVTYGQSTSIDVAKLRALRAQVPVSIFNKLFKSDTSYIAAPTAPTALASLAKPLRTLFASIFIIKPRDPSLKVEPKKKGGK